jgi:phage terminase Nu1 subunit (DNA packaging protein)
MTETAADDVRGLDETARFFEVTAPTVRAWIQAGCPVIERGGHGVPYKLSLRAVATWRKDRTAEEERQAEERAALDNQLRLELLGGESLAGADQAGLSPKQRADLLQEEMNRIKLARERGELVRAEDLRTEIADAFSLIRERLRAIPDQLARKYARSDEEIEVCRGIIDEALVDLADALSTGNKATADDEPKAATA